MKRLNYFIGFSLQTLFLFMIMNRLFRPHLLQRSETIYNIKNVMKYRSEFKNGWLGFWYCWCNFYKTHWWSNYLDFRTLQSTSIKYWHWKFHLFWKRVKAIYCYILYKSVIFLTERFELVGNLAGPKVSFSRDSNT